MSSTSCLQTLGQHPRIQATLHAVGRWASTHSVAAVIDAYIASPLQPHTYSACCASHHLKSAYLCRVYKQIIASIYSIYVYSPMMSVVTNKTQILCMYCMYACMYEICQRPKVYVCIHACIRVAVFVYVATLSTYIFMYELHVWIHTYIRY